MDNFLCLDSVQVPAHSPQQYEDSPQVINFLHASSLTRCILDFCLAWVPNSQGVTKRCRLPWPTNSALVYEPKCGGGEWPMSTAVHRKWVQLDTGAQINFGDLTPYLTYASSLKHKIHTVYTTEYTELQPLLSGVHSVMRVKLVLAGEGGGCTPTPSLYIYHHQ